MTAGATSPASTSRPAPHGARAGALMPLAPVLLVGPPSARSGGAVRGWGWWWGDSSRSSTSTSAAWRATRRRAISSCNVSASQPHALHRPSPLFLPPPAWTDDPRIDPRLRAWTLWTPKNYEIIRTAIDARRSRRDGVCRGDFIRPPRARSAVPRVERPTPAHHCEWRRPAGADGTHADAPLAVRSLTTRWIHRHSMGRDRE